MNIWFTSDWHIGHANIIKYSERPFKDVAEMTEELVSRHNAVVRPGDTVIDVGDFSMDSRWVEPTLKRLHGTRTLVSGNHDRCHPCHRSGEHWRKKYLSYGFKEVLASLNMDIGGQSVRVEHMPYQEDGRHGLKYAEWRPKDDGRWQLHGHVHNLWRVKGRMINVGVDVNAYRPVHIDEIAELISPRSLSAEEPL